MAKITVNGKDFEFESGQTVMEVARANDISIPHYCWHPAIPVVGSCRMCQVEIHGPGPQRLATACNTPCANGMVVETESPGVAKARAGNLEGLLVNHPLDCSICDKAGECWLQDYAYEYGAAAGRNDFERRSLKKRHDISEHVLLDQERCILCTRCVRFLDDYARKPELVVMGRGEHSTIDFFPGKKVSSPYQGNLADICPVGALTLKRFRFNTRVWYLTETDSVCFSCSRGCSITLDQRDNTLRRVRPRTNLDVNGYFICDTGRFGLLDLSQPENRIEDVAIQAEPASLEQAATAAAEHLREVGHAGGKLLVLASPFATNEELYLLKKILTEAGGDLGGKVTLAYRQVEEEGDDGILRTGQNAANVFGLKRFGYEEIARDAIDNRIGEAGGLYLLDGGLETILINTDLLIVQAVTSPVRQKADIVLPGSTFAEKTGTLTNFEGVTQRVMPALRHPQTVPGDYNCLLALGKALNVSDLPPSPNEAFMAWTDEAGANELTLAGLPAKGLSLAGEAKEPKPC